MSRIPEKVRRYRVPVLLLALFLSVVVVLVHRHVSLSSKATVYPLGTLYGREAKESNVTFLIVGDWGLRTGVQELISRQMQITAREKKVQFIVSVGDHFYSWGVSSVSDPLFRTVFEERFHSEDDDQFDSIPWYLALGNHDRRGNYMAQVEYSKVSSRWNMPDLYFSVDLPLLEDAPQLQLLFLDTLPLICPNADEVDVFQVINNNAECEIYLYSQEVRDLGVLLTENDLRRIANQTTVFRKEELRWLAEQLEATPRDSLSWRIVIGHHAMESACNVHGPRFLLSKEIRDLLNTHGADLYVAGHDHTMQHIHNPSEHLHHMVCGGGGFLTSLLSIHGIQAMYPYMLHGSTTFGFMAATASRDELYIEFISYRGEVVYNTTLHRPQGE